jgi:ADP-heptose:LPS heptosyltransferase
MPENSKPVSRPVSSEAVILYTEEDCSTCHCKRTILVIPCPFGNKPKCLENIQPEMVVRAARKLLLQS